MTIDKEKLKALAEAMLRDEQGAELSDEDVRGFPEAVRSYEAMTAPSAVLALLAEIEHLQDLVAEWRRSSPVLPSRACAAIIDQLKAENEALRKAMGDLLSLYEDDEGCRNLPEYIAGRAAMAKEAK